MLGLRGHVHTRAIWKHFRYEERILSVSGFRALFANPKPKLVNLRVDAGTATFQVVDNIFQVLGEKVSSLKHFDYSLKPVTLLMVFREGSACPCSAAKGVEESSRQKGKRIWTTIMNSFLRNKGLLHLGLSCSIIKLSGSHKCPDIADICTRARLGSTSDSMCGFHYA